MATWSEFEAAMPEMAAAGRKLLYQFGPGLGFLATVRKDGGPRLHPICPMIVDGALCALIGDSPKRADLLRDGRYAVHTFPPEAVDDEFYVTGRAVLVPDAGRRVAVYAAVAAQGTTAGEHELLFEFTVDRAMLATYSHRGPGSFPPAYTRWSAAAR